MSSTVLRQSVWRADSADTATSRPTLPWPSGDDMIGPTKKFRAAKKFWRRNMVGRLVALAPVVLMGISLLTWPAAHAEDVKLPPTMTFTAYDTGTAGFNIAVAVGKMMKDKYGTDLRVLPAGKTRKSVPYLSFIILPTATAILNPAPTSPKKACLNSALRNGARRPCNCYCRP